MGGDYSFPLYYRFSQTKPGTPTGRIFIFLIIARLVFHEMI